MGRGRSGSPGVAVAEPGAVRGAEPAVRSVPAPPWAAGASSIARFLVFSLLLTEKTNKQKASSLIAGKPFSSSAIRCFDCHSLTTQSWPEDPTGISMPEQSPLPFLSATAFRVQRLFNNQHTF